VRAISFISDELNVKLNDKNTLLNANKMSPCSVTWWRDHALLDSSYDNLGHKVVNELVLDDLQRSDLHTIFTCQAANNNISVPVSTSVKLDMNCEWNQKNTLKLKENTNYKMIELTNYNE